MAVHASSLCGRLRKLTLLVTVSAVGAGLVSAQRDLLVGPVLQGVAVRPSLTISTSLPEDATFILGQTVEFEVGASSALGHPVDLRVLSTNSAAS